MSNDLDSPYAVCNDARVKESWVPTALEFFFGIFGNVLAIILVWVNREKHKWIGFYRMFTALVITDFLGVFCTYPFAITRYISDFTYCFSTWECQFISFAMVAAHLAAAMLICAMSVDRMMILIRPERLYHPPPGYKYSAVILIIWPFSSVVAMLPLIGFGSVELFHPGSWCYFNFLKTDFAHLFMSYLFSILTFVVIIVTLISNIVTICRLCFRPVSRETLMDSNRVSGYLDNHVMAFIVTVTVSFVATCTPFFVSTRQQKHWYFISNVNSDAFLSTVSQWFFGLSVFLLDNYWFGGVFHALFCLISSGFVDVRGYNKVFA